MKKAVTNTPKLFLMLFSISFILTLFIDLTNEAQAQNRCPPGQREITIFGVPSNGPPTCTSDLPKGTITPVRCPKDLPRPPARFLPGAKVNMGKPIPGEKGHRYVDVGPGKFAKIYTGCLDKRNFFEIHNGERVVVKWTIRGSAGDLGHACHNNRCGYIYLADLRPINPPPVAGRRADENAGKIEGLDEKFYVAVPANRKLFLFAEPDILGDVVAELSRGTQVKGSKNNLRNRPRWKKVCTAQKCGYVVAGYLKQGTPPAINRQEQGATRIMKITARKLDVYAQPDGFSKILGALYQGQMIDVMETVVNDEGVRWTKICLNGCGWVITEDLR